MSIPSISELLTATTADEIFAVWIQALVNLGVPANQWRKGGVFSTILRVVAITYAGFTSLMVAALSAQFLPYATGGWLTLLAYYVYGVERTPATYASTPVVMTNTGGGVYDYAAQQFTIKDSTTGVTFVNQDAVNLAAAGTNPTQITVTFVAQTLGSAGNAEPGDIDTLVTSALGVSVTNPAAAIGTDPQLDADLRTDCTNALAARSVRGPRNAYSYAISIATNPVTGAPVSINRVQVLSPGATYVLGNPLPTPPAAGAPGTVTVYCASPSGAPSSDDLTGAAQSVEQNVRPGAATASLVAATEVPYVHTLTVYAKALPGLTVAALQTPADAAVTSLFSTYPIGGLATNSPSTPRGLFGTGLAMAIGATNPSAIFFVEDAANLGNAPPDLALANGQVAVDEVTLNFRLVPVST